MIVRVQFFGGILSRETYNKMVDIAFYAYIVLASLFSTVNLAMVVIESFSPLLYFQIAKEVALSFLLQSSILAICFLVVGSFLVRKLFVYFRRNYDCQRFSFLKALTLITTSLICINIRYGIEYILIQKEIKLQ